MIAEFIIAGVSFFQPQIQQDSLGTETVNGKIFVIHKVSEKETLYGISRRYGATVDAVLEFNPTASSGLEIGQILKVPYVKKDASLTKATTPANVSVGSGGIIHVVAQKETMFSISKAYNVSIDEIKQWNNLSDNSLSIGQELAIKKRNTQSTTSATTVQNTVTSPSTQKGIHIVDTKETMYSIARQYNVTVDQIREWNNMEGNDLKVGQSLIVAKPSGSSSTDTEIGKVQTAPPTTTGTNSASTASNSSGTLPAATNTTPPSTTSSNVEKSITPDRQSPTASAQTSGNTPSVHTQIPAPVIEKPTVVTQPINSADEVSEAGIAELIDGTEGNRKYLALHRTAPVGSILKVKNEMNNREVFVRVTGKLPENALTEKVVIRISKSAYDRLGAIDPKFRVQVTYYK